MIEERKEFHRREGCPPIVNEREGCSLAISTMGATERYNLLVERELSGREAYVVLLLVY
jgi:hypothetical protein